jgi:hypothetical protein
MNEVWRFGLASLVAIQALFTGPGAVVAGWRTVPTTAFIGLTGDEVLLKTLTGMQITASATSDRLYVHQSIPVVEGDVIDGIAVCYSTFAYAPTDRPPFITAISLIEVLLPSGATNRHVDDTDLTSQEEACYVSPVADYAPAGAVTLALQLNFNLAADPLGGGDGIIYVGAVAIHVK